MWVWCCFPGCQTSSTQIFLSKSTSLLSTVIDTKVTIFNCWFVPYHRYLYIPLGGSRSLKSAAFTSFMTFAIMGLWHGNYVRHYVWSLANWIGVVLETLVSVWAWSPKGLHYQVMWLKEAFSDSNIMILYNITNYSFLFIHTQQESLNHRLRKQFFCNTSNEGGG